MNRIIYSVIIFILATGCYDKIGYRKIKNPLELQESIGHKVFLTGRISDTPWQHIVANTPEYPNSYYFDIKDSQIIIYSASAIDCSEQLNIYGTVIEVKGLSKHAESEDDTFTEYHITIDKWECDEQ